MHRSISASMAASAGSLTFILLATSPIALMKQADRPKYESWRCTAPLWLPGLNQVLGRFLDEWSSLFFSVRRSKPARSSESEFQNVEGVSEPERAESQTACEVATKRSGHHLPACAPP